MKPFTRSLRRDDGKRVDFPTLDWASVDWQARAHCRDHPEPDLFFQLQGEEEVPTGHQPRKTARRSPRAESEAVRAQVRAFCAPCPVRRECAAYAVHHGIVWGYWGGLSWRERSKVGVDEAV